MFRLSVSTGIILLASLSATEPRAAAEPAPKILHNLLPTYAYGIQSGRFIEGGVMTGAVRKRIPNTVWFCSLTYQESGIVVRCNAPTVGQNDMVEVGTFVSCKAQNSDSQKLIFATLDSTYATVFVECNRELTDDGF